MPTNKIAADAVVLAEDVAEEVVEQAGEVVTIVKNNPILLVGVGLTAAALGGFVGYKVAVKRLEPKYEAMLEKEIAEAREFLNADLEKQVEESEEIVEEVLSEEEQALEEKIVRSIRQYHRAPIVKTVKPIEDDEYHTEADVAKLNQDRDLPHFISFDEYHSGDRTLTQLAMTYYEQDDTLADENDQVIEEVGYTVGVDNLDYIRKSEKRTFFIRNPKVEVEWEIAKYDRSYAKTVLGDRV